MVLTQEEIDGCRDAFLAFDKDRSGTIDVWELRQVLEAMGQKPTEEELFQMISEVDDNMSGSIDFGEFLKVIENQKSRAENFDDESDMSACLCLPRRRRRPAPRFKAHPRCRCAHSGDKATTRSYPRRPGFFRHLCRAPLFSRAHALVQMPLREVSGCSTPPRFPPPSDLPARAPQSTRTSRAVVR